MTRAAWVLAVLLSHWRRHPMQLATLLVGLIAATALWSGVQALNQQARISYDRAAALFGGARTAMLIDPAHATFPQSAFVELRRAGWPVSPVLEDRVQVNGRSVRLLGSRAPALGEWHRIVDKSIGDRSDVHFNATLRPQLQRLFAARLAERHGVDLYRRPERAKALVGADLWPWIDPERRPAHRPDHPERVLRALLDRLEAL